MNLTLDRELRRLDRLYGQLAEAVSLKEVRAVRDMAEAARNLARSGELGMETKNRATELKLRAERRAGELLRELLRHGGDRRSSSSRENLKLAELGVNHNQSARWQLMATVPTTMFEKYIQDTNAAGQEISVKGLLRLLRSNPIVSKRLKHCRPCRSNFRTALLETAKASELIDELRNHLRLLETILVPICNGHNATLESAEKRIVIKKLRENLQLVDELQQRWATPQ